MELTTLKPLDGAEVQIKHPITNELLDIVFVVYGSDSKQYRQAQRQALIRRIESNNTNDLDEDEMQVLVECVKSFSGIELDGVKLKYSKENVEKVFREYAWLKDQISTFIMNRNNFFLKPSSNSTSTLDN